MRIRLFAFCLLLGGCQSQLPPLPDWQSPEGRDDPQTGRIVELRSGVTLSPQQLVARLAAAPRVIVGEKHDNPDHHAVELWLAQALGEYRAQGSLLLEMLDPGQQPRVDAVRAQLGNGKPVANLEQALDWQKRWDWTQYGPLVSWAVAQPAPLLAANLQRSEIMRIYRERPPLPGTASRRDSVRLPLLAQIRIPLRHASRRSIAGDARRPAATRPPHGRASSRCATAGDARRRQLPRPTRPRRTGPPARPWCGEGHSGTDAGRGRAGGNDA